MADININIYRTHSKISKLERRLYHNQNRSYVLDGDNIRCRLN